MSETRADKLKQYVDKLPEWAKGSAKNERPAPSKSEPEEYKMVPCKWCGCSTGPGIIVTCFNSPTGFCESESGPEPAAPAEPEPEVREQVINLLREEIVGFNTTRTMYGGFMYALAKCALTAEAKVAALEAERDALKEKLAKAEDGTEIACRVLTSIRALLSPKEGEKAV